MDLAHPRSTCLDPKRRGKSLDRIKRYLELGTDPGLVALTNRRIWLTNLISMTVGFFASLYTFLFWNLGFPLLGALMVIITIYYLLVPPLLNHLGRHDSAKFALTGFFAVTVGLYSLLLHPDSGIPLLYFPLSILPMVLFGFHQRIRLALCLALPLVACSLVYCFGEYYESPLQIAPKDIPLIFYPALYTALLINLLTLGYFAFSSERAMERAKDALQFKSMFLANISHEVRTPMNGVLGPAELLLQKDLDSDSRHHVQTIVESGQLMLEILNDVLNLVKLESGKSEVELRAFDLHEELRSIEQSFCLQAQAKGVDFSVRIAPNLPRRILSDSTRIRQILGNLISNAIKFTNEGSIEVSVEREKSEETPLRLLFCVRDTGIGIAPEKCDDIFEAFTQADLSTTRCYGGTGLGLAICKQIAELLGSQIFVESSTGKGSRFSFSLDVSPARATTQTSPSKPRKTDPQGLSSGLSLLLVEDNLLNQKITNALLQSIGQTADLAANGEDAVAMVQQKHYDLVLMDCQMPVMDGFTATPRDPSAPPRQATGHHRHDRQRFRE